MKTLVGALAGFFAGLLAMVVFPGPLGMPAVGFALGIGILASGAWFMWEWDAFRPWVGYVIAVFATTAWLVYFPPSDDVLAAASALRTNVWMVASTVAVVAPVPLIVKFTKGREHADS